MSGVIKDDSVQKMFYGAIGEISENTHTEVFVMEGKKVKDFFEKYRF